jgi:tricorn protease
MPEELPLPRGGFASYSADGKQLAFNRIFREFRTWKRYRGGMADDVWLYDFGTKKTEQLTDDPGQDIFPMFVGGKVYFISDRGKEMRFNLHSVDPATKKVERHTDFTEFDIKFPSAGKDRIVFENSGYIYAFDPKAGKAEKVSIRIRRTASAPAARSTDVSKSVASFEVSHDGKRGLFAARGDVFTVPAADGVTRNLTRTPGRPRPQPEVVARRQERRLHLRRDRRGRDPRRPGRRQRARQADHRPAPTPTSTRLLWAPDSKKILWSDKKLRLQFVEVESKKVTLVDQAKAWEIRDFAWSPDSKWVAFGRQEVDTLNKVHLYSLESGKATAVTDGWYASGQPAFSADGKYLFFVSARDFNPIYSSTEWNHAYRDMQRVYLVTLAKGTPNPLKPKLDDEPTEPKPEPKKDEKKDGPAE